MDCTTNCKFKPHGAYLTSAVSALMIDDLKERLPKHCSNLIRNTDFYGRNVLHIAASCGKDDIIQWICETFKGNFYLQMKDRESGWTALHRACYYGNIGCIITINKILSDWSSVDFEGHTALDLVLLDSPRTKKKRKRKERLAVVKLPFEAGDIHELTLHVGDVLEILSSFNFKSGWGVGKIKETGVKGLFPLNFVEEVKSTVAINSCDLQFEQQDVYMWGNNVNFTLGLGDSKNRARPEVVEQLWREKKSISQICVSKFHSVFLTTDNQVYSCGHGLGGRLGHSNEETVMLPTIVDELSNITCISIAASTHHTMVLDIFLHVWCFGSNDFHQLGFTPPPKKCLSPTTLSHKFLKGKEVIGIGAARFHSIIYTKNELYSFGLNAGQLGHPKGDQLQTIPKLVSQLYRKDTSINQVIVSDGATLCSMKNGDIYLLQDYVCRKIAIKMTDITHLCMSGGILDYKGTEHHSPEPLQVAVLKQSGIVECWKLHYRNFKKCHWLGNTLVNRKITSIALGRHIILTTDDGQAFNGHFRNKTVSIDKVNQNSPTSSQITTEKPEIETGRYSLTEIIDKNKEKRKDYEEIFIEKIPFCYRCLECFCDSKSRIFAVVQADPRFSLTRFPVILPSSMKEDFHRLLKNANLSDTTHDAVVKANSSNYPVHQFIITCRLSFDAEIKNLIEINGDKVFYMLNDQSDELVYSWLEKVYKGDCETTFFPSRNDNTGDKKLEEDDEVLLATTMLSLTKVDIENPIEELSTFVDEEYSRKLHKRRNQMNKSGNRLHKQDREDGKSDRNHNNKSAYAVHKESKKEKQSEKKQDMKMKSNKKINFKLCNFENWEKFGDLSDITIESEEGTLLRCHKCLLISRLEYFSNMLNNDWLESSLHNGNLKMPIPYTILKVVIDYLYTDKASTVEVSTDISFIGEVLVCADQLLIKRLKSICELSLAKKVCLKNAIELLQFSCTFNVEQLKALVCEFISLNLPYYLCANLLNELSSEELGILTKIYREMVDGMELRFLKPSHYYEEIDRKDKEFEDQILIELKKIKQRRRTISNENQSRQHHMMTSSKTEQMQSCETVFLDEQTKTTYDKIGLKIDRHVSCSSIGEQEDRTSDVIDKRFEETNKVRSTPTDVWNVTDGRSTSTSIESNDMKVRKTKNKASPFKKVSQKERKQLLEDKEPLLEEKDVPLSSDQPKAAWGQVRQTTPMKSFKELISADENELSLSKSSRKSLNFPQVSGKPKREKLTIIPNKETTTPGRNNPWRMVPARSLSVEKDEISVFSTILNVQQEEKHKIHLQLKKPLTVIQLEERAMEELRVYYEQNADCGEYVTVTRVKRVTDLPFWERVLAGKH